MLSCKQADIYYNEHTEDKMYMSSGSECKLPGTAGRCMNYIIIEFCKQPDIHYNGENRTLFLAMPVAQWGVVFLWMYHSREEYWSLQFKLRV